MQQTKIDPYANVDWSLPCKEIARLTNRSLNYVYNLRSHRGIKVAHTRYVAAEHQPEDFKLIHCKQKTTPVFTYVSNEDYANLRDHSWYIGQGGYPYTRVNKKLTSMHRLLGAGQQFDHINRNPLDNRRSNLRPATQGQNTFNRETNKRKTSSRFKGVGFRKDLKQNPWFAHIQCKGKKIWLGYHFTEEGAALAYDKAASLYFGEFAYLNFPIDR